MTQSGQGAAFIKAVQRGDVEAVRLLATQDPSLLGVTNPDSFGATPLIHAVRNDDSAMVDLLLGLGAEIDQRSNWWAGSFGVLDECSDEMGKRLLARGATLTAHAAARLGMIEQLREMVARDPGVVSARGGDGQAPLHFARTVEIAELLLGAGARVDELDIDHASTPAQWLGGSRSGVTAFLVSRGAAPDPFMAVRIGDTALLERLLSAEPGGIDVRVSRERFPVKPPAAGHIYIFTIGEGCGLIHAAASANRPEMVRWLVAKGGDVNARGGYDEATPLHLAAWGDQPEMVRTLLDCGAGIEVPSGARHRNEPLGWAIVGGSVHAARALLERGAVVREHHKKDGERGARGEFRELARGRPLSAWSGIAEMLASR